MTTHRRDLTLALHMCLNLCLQWLAWWSYIESLEGGDLEWIKKNLDSLATNLLLSIVCFSIAITHLLLLKTLSSQSPPVLLRPALAFCLALLLYSLYKYDNGDTPQEHGFYNFLVFTVISVPLNILITVMGLCYMCMAPKRFLVMVGTIAIVSVLFLSTRLVHYTLAWKYGALGKKMESGEHLCTYGGKGRNIPFVDMLPNGVMNVWTGRQSCHGSDSNKFKAEWNETDGSLYIKCPKNLDPSYEIIPDTKNFKATEKAEGNFHKVVKEKTRKREYSQGPVIIDDLDAQAIVAKCGPDLEKLLLRVGPPKASILERVKKNSGLKSQPPNIFVLFLDAVSRRQFFRKLPKTARILESLTTKTQVEQPRLSLHQFFRYHAIGFSTDPNTRALYTNSSTKHSPPLAPIWKDFHASGTGLNYMTARIETNCEDWSTQYTGASTSSESLDYELLAPFCLPEYYPATGNPFGNFQGPYSITARCLTGKYVHNYALEFMSKLQNAYSKIPWFIIGSFIEGHEGTGEVVGTLDDDLADFLLDMEHNGFLENTVVFIMSDHGLHMGLNFLYTTNGKLEHMNPLLMMLLPPKLGSGYPSLITGLNHTEQLLLTPYEVYNTLKLFSRGLENAETEEPKSWRKGTLFDETMASRDCEQAQIPGSHCKCY